MNKEKVHRACEDYVSIDVFKGYCHTYQKLVNADEKACLNFVPIPKCGLCTNYQPQDETMGTCMSHESTFQDLTAKTCENFKWLKKD